jgi:hypothetical protein
MYKLSSQITYALRSHAADLAEEEDRVLASLEPDPVDNQEMTQGQGEQTRDVQASEVQVHQLVPVPVDSSSPVKRGRGRPRNNVVETPVKSISPEKKEDRVEIELPVFHVEPPSVRRSSPTQTTPARRTKTALAPPVSVAFPAANTRSRNRTPVSLEDTHSSSGTVASTLGPMEDSGSEDMITITPVKRVTRTIRKTRSSSKLAE